MVTLYTEQESGNLKFLAEVEDVDDAVEAVEAFAEDNPRKNIDEFVALVGDLENGTVVTVRQVEEVRRGWGTSSNGVAEDEEDEAPAPRKRGPGRPKGSGKKRGPGRPKGSTNKAKSGGGGRRGRQATLTEDVLEQALSMHNDDGMTMKQIAEELGVSSSGYLAKKIRETFGDDALGEVRRGRPPAKRDDEDEAPKRRRGRPKGSTNKSKSSGAKRGPGRPKGSKNKRGPGRPKGSGKKRTPFATTGDDD